MLVEAVAALAITIMLVTFVFPAIPTGTTPARFVGLVGASVALLRDARTAAIARGTSVAATFEPARRSFVFGAQRLAIPPDVDVSIVAGGNCGGSDAKSQILFRPDGTNCGGIVRFARGSRVLRARINWLDGHVDVVDGG